MQSGPGRNLKIEYPLTFEEIEEASLLSPKAIKALQDIFEFKLSDVNKLD